MKAPRQPIKLRLDPKLIRPLREAQNEFPQVQLPKPLCFRQLLLCNPSRPKPALQQLETILGYAKHSLTP